MLYQLSHGGLFFIFFVAYLLEEVVTPVKRYVDIIFLAELYKLIKEF